MDIVLYILIGVLLVLVLWLVVRLGALEKSMEVNGRMTREEFARNRSEAGEGLKGFNDSVVNSMTGMGQLQKDQLTDFAARLDKLNDSLRSQFDAVRETVEKRLQKIQEDNARQLEDMRKTVDERLQGTLEKRLGESFKLVSDRLEQVHKGLGEMQELATGVGDLKRVLTNVKTRGTWGEIQLGNLLEQMLAPEQFEKNVTTKKGSREQVEYAVKLPGREDNPEDVVYLPIDAKFPKEDYERLVEAADKGEPGEVDKASKQLLARIRLEAKSISEKYLNPPVTTDFGIMFLPTEGLYGEVLRSPGLLEELQRVYRVNVTGPTTLAALLNSLQMGFKTLAIQKRSSEVWQILAGVKSEFGKFGAVIEKVQRKLDEASQTIDKDVAVRTRAIERKLRGVEGLVAGEDALLEEGA